MAIAWTSFSSAAYATFTYTLAEKGRTVYIYVCMHACITYVQMNVNVCVCVCARARARYNHVATGYVPTCGERQSGRLMR